MQAAGDQPPAQCPFCGRRVEKSAFLPYYDAYACPDCRASIMARRVGAYLFDQFVVTYIGATVLLVIGIALVWGLDLDVRTPVFAIAVLVAFFGSIGAWLTKDGWFNGRSPGKAVFGLRVVRVENGQPISALGSFIRNLPLLIGLVPLIVAVQISSGSMRRWGDGMAGSKVVRAEPSRRGRLWGAVAAAVVLLVWLLALIPILGSVSH